MTGQCHSFRQLWFEMAVANDMVGSGQRYDVRAG
jgi:hypothetical protein